MKADYQQKCKTKTLPYKLLRNKNQAFFFRFHLLALISYDGNRRKSTYALRVAGWAKSRAYSRVQVLGLVKVKAFVP